MATFSKDYSISVRQGETTDFRFTYNVLDAATGVVVRPVDITGFSFRFAVRVKGVVLELNAVPVEDDATDEVLYGIPAKASSIAVESGTEGIFRLYLSAIFTKRISAGTHSYEIDMVDTDGNVTTFAAGELEVVRDVR